MSPLTHRISRSTWYVLVVIYVSMFAAVAATMIYTNHVAQVNAQKWCGVLRVYHDAYQHNPPPPTQLGKDIQAQLEGLYADFHCDKIRRARN